MSNTIDIQKVFQDALAYHLSGDLNQAEKLYTKIILEAPDHLNALVNLGAILIDVGRPAEAVRYLEQARKLEPEDAETLNNLANALQKSSNSDQVLTHLVKASSIAPQNAAIASNLARALFRAGDYQGGLDAISKAIAIDPTNIAYKVLDALAAPIIPNSQQQIAANRNRMKLKINELISSKPLIENPAENIGGTNFTISYQGQDNRDLQEKLAELYREGSPDLNFVAPHVHSQRKSGKIKIGFVSAHLGSHTIGKLNRALICGLDPSKFEVHVFCPGQDSQGSNEIIDEIAESVAALYFPTPELSATRQCITEAELDILYYLDIGMEPLTYFLAFSRLANIQCVTVGHPETTGIPTIDYFISSKYVEPPGADKHYSEKLVQLPSFFADYARPRLPEKTKSRANFNLNKATNLYFCPQSLFKFHPDFDEILAGILAADVKAEIILLAGPQKQWTDILSARFSGSIGIDAGRISILPRQSGEDFLHLLRLANVVLDTPHFSGGNSSYEAFALHKAIVTLPGEFMRSRVTAGLYKLMGYPDLITTSPEAYIEKATSIGGDRDKQVKIEAKLKQLGQVIFDTTSATRAHEQFFLDVID